MLKIRPSARLRVATSSSSVSLSATTFSRTTSSTGAPLSSTTTWVPATPARSSMMSWRKPRRPVTVPTRPTFASGFSTASSVTRSVSATGRPLTSCFTRACISCVPLPRRPSRSQVAGARCAAPAAALHAPQTSSSPTIVLCFIVIPFRYTILPRPMRRQFLEMSRKVNSMRRAGGFVSLTGIAVAIALATLAGQARQGGTSPAAGAQRYATWQSYAGGAHSSQYSALDQINGKNVAKLQVAWSFPITGNSIFNPVVVDGVMYAPVGGGALAAIDAATGKEIWRKEGAAPSGARGMNYWESSDRSDRRFIYLQRGDVIAVNARDGELITSFGNNGRVDLRDAMERKPSNPVGTSNPGRIFENLLIIPLPGGPT